jgi:sigma-B regulation protein RsbU (phosphoserine phosphatase)
MGLFSRKPSTPSEKPPEPAPAPAIRKADIDTLMADLAAGAEFQRDLMPKEPPQVPGYDLGFVYRGARNISGDFYDFIPIDVGKIGIAIADASGKGIPASLLTMTCRAMLHAQPEPDAPPARVLTHVNRMLRGNVKRGMFVTGVYGVLDTSWHTFTLANAGHLPTVVWRSKAKIAMTYPPRGPVLGVTEPEVFEAAMKEDVIQLEPGDRFLLMTDGVNEAMAPGQKEYGMEHLRKRLAAASDAKSSDLLKRIVDSIDIHRAGGEQSDDITIVTGRRLPS